VTGWIDKDAESVATRLEVRLGRAERERATLCLHEIVNNEIEMRLRRRAPVGPLWWFVWLDPLKVQPEPTVDGQCNEFVVGRADAPSEDALVETGKR
jgi:hypothetical protein